ncbi:flagellar basal body-associated FliL family protein [Actinoplanes sp. NEAU-A12]|uniref:Flagellar protein FliL n=1 Tax=Actinoplanes sandaracinus TaxID=3045177 RepID=A0ABT6WW58_9ACTN|nr:flagellar basal body-associated FliL family protein [Actinoplanes sandaracinus]MDI6103950.1 flagellar basal body-associated FliL family protein [Actinoplanes sandaracinus]
MADEKDTAAEAPKKSNKMLMIIIALSLVVLGGGGAGAFFMLRGDTASAAEEAPVKGIITAAENALTVNLAEGHYLKLGFALQQTEDSGEEAVDLSEAYELAIDEYTGRSIAELSTEEGRTKIKEQLVAKLIEAYTKDDKKMVMDIYYTSFVTQ